MNTLFPATVAALVLVSACNKPEPPPEAAAPANEATVAAAGAPMADSIAVTDSVTNLPDSTIDTTQN